MTRPAPEGENENTAQNLIAATWSLKHLLAGERRETGERERDGNGYTGMTKNEQVTEGGKDGGLRRIQVTVIKKTNSSLPLNHVY